MEVPHTYMNQQIPVGPPRGFRDILPTEARELAEIEQTGVELVGGDGALADAEILALLVEALERCGLCIGESTVQVGNVRFLSALFAALSEEVRGEVLNALRNGDIAGGLGRAREA